MLLKCHFLATTSTHFRKFLKNSNNSVKNKNKTSLHLFYVAN